jgi:ketosteroid isomerase-like protein
MPLSTYGVESMGGLVMPRSRTWLSFHERNKLTVVLFLLLPLVVGQAWSSPAAVQVSNVDFARIEQELARAWVEGDRATIDRIVADDWTTTDIAGRLRTRAEVMADMFRSGTKPIAAMTIDDVRVRMLGDVAVVTGRTTARATGSQTDIFLRFTDVFTLRDGRWQIVASQGTRIPARTDP